MKSIVLIACVLACAVFASAQVFEFNGNVTIDDPHGVLNYRRTHLIALPLNHAVLFNSLRLTATKGDATLDQIAGVISYEKLPFAVLGYWSKQITWDADSIDVNAANNIMGKAYLQLQERYPNGSVAATYGLGGGPAQVRDWTLTSNAVGALKWAHIATPLTHPVNGGSFKLGITFFLSSVVGQVNYANTTLTPRTLESVIRITNYTYMDPANQLTLTLAAAHSSGSFTASGRTLSTGNNGLGKLYLSLSAECQIATDEDSISGEIKAVTIASWDRSQSAKDAILGTDAALLFNAKFNSNWDVDITTITFPAGASHIIYDPALGSSTEIGEPSGDAGALIPSLLSLIAFILSFFLSL